VKKVSKTTAGYQLRMYTSNNVIYVF